MAGAAGEVQGGEKFSGFGLGTLHTAVFIPLNNWGIGVKESN